VHHHRIAFTDPEKKIERLAARHEVVLGDDLEPVDIRLRVEDLVVVVGAKAESVPQPVRSQLLVAVRMIKRLGSW